MKAAIILSLTISLAFGQAVNDTTRRLVDQVFPGRTGNDIAPPGFEEVTTKSGGSLGALQRCGEGSDQGVHICVSYHMCDGKTKTVVQTGVTDGFGIIDIRFGENSCPHPLEVCCGLPEGGLDPKLPLPVTEVPTPPTVPPVTPTATPFPDNPVTPQSPSYCGLRNPNGIDFKIEGARDHEAEYGEFPWMAAILNRNLNPSLDPNYLMCGGSLITPKVVLTGAHCVNKASTGDLTVRLGEWDTQTTRERLPYQERGVINILSRNDFNPGTLFNDVALLVLDRPVNGADNVGTICLPVQGERINSKNCFVSGWGKDVFGKQGRSQAILKKIELPIVPRQACQTALRGTRLGKDFNLHKSFICAGGEQGKDACTGDGGSPLVCPDPNNPSRYVQAGIVGWGIGCGTVGVPGVYADVAKFRSWIDEQMERLNLDTAPYNV
nr:serine protease 44-like [Leptinotarsa decemlineata]